MTQIVLDTNVLLISLPKISPYRPIFDSLISGKFKLLITEGIFQEYKEIISQKTTPKISENLGELLMQLENVKNVSVFYQWNLIKNDPDDNKFVDCAIAGNAKFIVTNDNHFNILRTTEFPKVKVIDAKDFLKIIE